MPATSAGRTGASDWETGSLAGGGTGSGTLALADCQTKNSETPNRILLTNSRAMTRLALALNSLKKSSSFFPPQKITH